jgi:hypothetical protein
MSFRRIKPMRELLPRGFQMPDLGRRPELRWVDPTSLLVDESYQRDLTKRSIGLIKRLLQRFAWRKMKPPIVVDVAGELHCIDGQHTAIAAATIGILEIPVFMVDADSLEERADAFVAHNKDRVVMSPFDVYRGALGAGNADALDCASVCRRAGVTIKIMNVNSRVDIGDTACVGTVQRLVKRQGVMKSRMVLEALVKGARAPISAPEIDATEAAMLLVRPATTIEEMAAAIRAVGDHGLVAAKMAAFSEEKPVKHALFEAYMAFLEKQTGVTRAIAG